MTRHYETHLYTYATFVKVGPPAMKPENIDRMRAKAIKFGHTLGETMCVDRDPDLYIRTGRFK